MLDIIVKKIEIDDTIKTRISLICNLAHVKPVFHNRSLQKINHSNLVYVEPHRIDVKNITILAINYSNEVYINNIHNKLKLVDLEESQLCDDLSFVPEDILLKRDIDFINSIKHPEQFKKTMKYCNNYTRDEKALFIMRYIDEIELEKEGLHKYKVKEILFRKSITEPFNELWRNGYIDNPVKVMFEEVQGFVRFSEFNNDIDIEEYLKRLRQFYNVSYYAGDYIVKDKIFKFYSNGGFDKNTIVRIFPLEDYNEIDPEDKLEIHKFGSIYINDKIDANLVDMKYLFNSIPAHDEKNINAVNIKCLPVGRQTKTS